jgi:(p)ppGpp synthase/HD superfamily hydrolase
MKSLLKKTYHSLKRILRKNKGCLLISKRLKRFVSIKAKILKQPQMDISRMNDIGGVRIVFDTLVQVYAFRDKIISTKSKVFSVLKKKMVI